MSSTTAFFNPTSPFGSLTGWEDQTDNPQTQRQRAQALGKDGDEIASQTYDEKTVVTAEYVAKSASAAIPEIGSILNGYHVDTIQLRYVNTDFARMTITGHKHGSSAHPACRTYKDSGTGAVTTVGVLFGCPATPAGFTIPQGAGVRSCSVTFQVNHVDELNGSGSFLAGDNYDGSMTAETELCDTGTITAASGWSLMADGHARGNTVAETSTATAEKHLAHTVVSGGGD